MEKIIFATSNEKKVISAQKYFQTVELVHHKCNLVEPRAESLEEIATQKVMQAYEEVKSPCFCVDSGFYIVSLNGWPGSFINFNLEKLGLPGILKLLVEIENRQAYFKDCLAYYDGKQIKYFYGYSEGTIAKDITNIDVPRQWSTLWKIFIPLNHDKTLAEMTEAERNNRHDGHTSSFQELNKYIKEKQLIKK